MKNETKYIVFESLDQVWPWWQTSYFKSQSSNDKKLQSFYLIQEKLNIKHYLHYIFHFLISQKKSQIIEINQSKTNMKMWNPPEQTWVLKIVLKKEILN